MAATRGIHREISVPQSREPGSVSVTRAYSEHARVAVVSDQRLVRDAIKVALRNRGFSATAYQTPTTAGELWDLARQLQRFDAVAGLLVSELDDPREVREASAVVTELSLSWLVLTGSGIGPGWGAMVEAGAAGVLSMSTGLDQLAGAVNAVIVGNPVMRPSTRLGVLRQWQAQGAELDMLAERMAALTPRETQILEHLRDGEPVKAIAEAAGVSEGTVRSQVKSILRKLGVSSQLGAVAVLRRLTDGSENSRRPEA